VTVPPEAIVHLVGDEDDWTECRTTETGPVNATHNPDRVTCPACLLAMASECGDLSRCGRSGHLDCERGTHAVVLKVRKTT
jgi:hypothetical protein